MQYTDLHLLIIDDLEDNRTLLRADLEDELPGIQIDEAASGAEGVRMIEENNYTIVICDVLMPQVDGFSVLAKVREMPSTNGIPFLFLSALKQPDTIRQGLALGAVDFLVKPYDLDELVNKVRNLSRIRQLQVDLKQSQKQLMETNIHLQQMNEDKNRIMQIVSHDLRSPLSGIKGLAKILQTEDDAGDPDTVREFAAMIADTADTLTRLVNDLLNVTRIEAGAQIELQPVDCNLNDLLLSCINMFSKLAEKKSIRLEYNNLSRDTRAFIDQPKITQVVNNLLSNAVKFTHAGGTILIVLQDDPAAPSTGFKLSIRDSGIGIPIDQIPYLFEKFSEGRRSGTNNERGVGLGLPIVHSFVKLHGGKVKVQSEEGRGTTVEVTMPRTLKQGEPALRPGMQNGSIKSR